MAFSSKGSEIKGHQPKRGEDFGHQPTKAKEAAGSSVSQARGKPPKGGPAVKSSSDKK